MICCCIFLLKIDKAYPRDFMQRGRVRVMLKHESGTFSNPAVTSRKQLMLQVAEMVPRHQGRTKKQETASASTKSTKAKKKRTSKGVKACTL
uniref:Signal recognition particle 19 kDa protein n=1 Tax=Kalanchoe fedtschenkoi TaxID=63787 RepID=A0A7N0UHU2_KALFE